MDRHEFSNFSCSYLKVVHAVGECDHKAGVVVYGLIAEDDVHPVVEIPEIILGRRQLTAVILWVVPVGREGIKERRGRSEDGGKEACREMGVGGRKRGDM